MPRILACLVPVTLLLACDLEAELAENFDPPSEAGQQNPAGEDEPNRPAGDPVDPAEPVAPGDPADPEGTPDDAEEPEDVQHLDPDDDGPAIEEITPDADEVVVNGVDWLDIHTLPEDHPRRQRARAVGYVQTVVIEAGDLANYRCTGWLVGESLIITNYHCIVSPEALLTATINFDYLHPDDYDSRNALRADAFSCDEIALASPNHDIAVLRCSPRDGVTPHAHVGTFLELEDRAPIEDEPIYLLHQNCFYQGDERCTFDDTPPGEATKKMSPGQVTTAALLAYNTDGGHRIAAGAALGHDADTLGGTSGSPVLTADHRVIALHHSGSAARRENNALRFDVMLDALPLGPLLDADRPAHCDDRDGDGYGDGCAAGPDCDDAHPSRHPGASETCGDGIDDNCDGADEPCPPVCAAGTFRPEAGHCLRCDGARWADIGAIPANTACTTYDCDPAHGLTTILAANGAPCPGGACQAGRCVAAPAMCDVPLARVCGACGHQNRACVNGQPGAWGPCEDEGPCAPGDQEACGQNGVRTCTGACQWDACFEECDNDACSVRFRAGNTRILEVEATAFHLHDGTHLAQVLADDNVCVIGWALGQWGFHHQEFRVRDDNGDGWIDITLPVFPAGLAPFAGCRQCNGRLPYRFNLRRCAADLIAVGHYLNVEEPWGPKTGDFSWSGRDDQCTWTGGLAVSFDGAEYYASGAESSPLSCGE